MTRRTQAKIISQAKGNHLVHGPLQKAAFPAFPFIAAIKKANIEKNGEDGKAL